MKTIRTLNNKKFITITILLTMFLMTLISCQKGGAISETDRQSDELSLEEKSSDNSEDKENKLFSDDSEEKPPKFKDMSNLYPSYMTLLYKYDGYWSMRFDEYFRLDDRDYRLDTESKWKGTGFNPKGPYDTE